MCLKCKVCVRCRPVEGKTLSLDFGPASCWCLVHMPPAASRLHNMGTVITLCQWTDLGPASDSPLLCVLTNHSFHQEEWNSKQQSKQTVRQQEDTCKQKKKMPKTNNNKHNKLTSHPWKAFLNGWQSDMPPSVPLMTQIHSPLPYHLLFF